MSHFISGMNIPSQPILGKNQLKDMIAPKYKHVLKGKGGKLAHLPKQNQNWKQQIAIANLCKKLSEKQFILLRKQNATQIEHHFSKLKTKIKKSLQPNAPSVERFFQYNKQESTLNIKNILEKMPKKVLLENKYNKKIINYAESINSAWRINNDKQNYTRWLDHQNNSPIKSPNYSRMSFVLERLGGNVESRVLMGHCRRAGQLSGCGGGGENSVIKYMKNQCYKAKPSRVKTLGNDISIIYK